jgi:biopolymer transport protein ExbB
MPASVVLSWFESRMAEERALADHTLSVVLGPDGQAAAQSVPQGRAVSQGA